MTNYYVDNTVGGPGSGTIGDPWDDIASNINSLSAGDTMYVRGDVGSARVHSESDISWTVNGSSGSPITLMPYPGEEVELRYSGSNSIFIEISGNYAVVDGFELDAQDDYYMVPIKITGNNCTIQNCPAIHNMATWATIQIESCTDATVDNCVIYDNYVADDEDASGVWVSDSEDFTVQDCTIYDMCGDCIVVVSEVDVCDGFLIENNLLSTTLGQCSENAIDIKTNVGTKQGIIRGNTMHGFRTCTATCGGSGDETGEAIFIHDYSENILIEDNLIHNCTTGIILTGISPSTSEDLVVQNNVIRDLVDTGTDTNATYAAALRIYAVTNGILIYNNTFDDCPGSSYLNLLNCTATFKNNIFNDCDEITSSGSSITADHNCWYNCTDTISGSGDVTSDPDFVDEAGNDFELNSGSPCIDAGTDVGLDYNGSAPDMGAYEYEGGFMTINRGYWGA